MPENFYFAYNYDRQSMSASRLYRFIDGRFERYNPPNKTWIPDPAQCRIFIGEDWEYEEISEAEANKIADSISD